MCKWFFSDGCTNVIFHGPEGKFGEAQIVVQMLFLDAIRCARKNFQVRFLAIIQ